MPRKKKVEEKWKVLEHVDHVLLRSQTYLGSNKPHKEEKYVVDKKDNMILKELNYIPSFIKLFDEIISNSIDESKNNNKLNKIDIKVNKKSVSVKDNGGIPVVIHKDENQYLPEVIFGNLMSGSNYDDTEDRLVAGTNGLGAKLTNIFSEKFIVKTCDGKKQFVQTFKNNMKKRNKPKITKRKTGYTEITYYPDFSRFDINEIDQDHYDLIKKRVYDVCACNPYLNLTFNGKKIKINSFKDYIKKYTKDYIFQKDGEWSLGIALSETGFQQISFVNSIETYDGGSHVDYISKQIVDELREHFNKKHKYDVKPSQLKNHMMLFLDSQIVNPSFSAQTKEKLITEVKNFGYEFKVNKSFIKKILKSEIVESILDWIEQKKEADERKMKRKLNKNLSKVKVDKLIEAKSDNRKKCTLGLFEGDSAISAFREFRDTKYMGGYPLKGKFNNVSKISDKKLAKTDKITSLMAAIGLKLGVKAKKEDLNYGKILIYTDADHDGNSIAAALINFFYSYWPELFDQKIVYKVETPIVVTESKRGNKKNYFYTNKEFNKWLNRANPNNYNINYKKGLAALVDEEYKKIIQKPKLTLIQKDKNSKKNLKVWFGKDSESKKESILNS